MGYIPTNDHLNMTSITYHNSDDRKLSNNLCKRGLPSLVYRPLLFNYSGSAFYESMLMLLLRVKEIPESRWSLLLK